MGQREMYKKMMGRPNFIIIHTDQQRYDCVNISGRRPEIYTPYQDSIANMGMRFTSCYSTCPVCIPQRLSLLTGQSPQKHGVYDNVGIPNLDLETTFPMEMKKGGYKTACIGRTMHTYPFDNPYGFETYLPGDPVSNCKATDGFYQFIDKYAPEGSGGMDGNGAYTNSRFAAPYHLENRFHQTMWATNQAIDYIRERKEDSKPFFLMLGYFAPHTPFNPPKEWMDYYMGMELPDRRTIADYDEEPQTNGHPISDYCKIEGEELRRIQAAYYGNISFLDGQIGRILNEILILPNTYVIVTSDHGEMLGDHYRMHKNVPYQGAVHTPLMLYGPGIIGDSVCDTPIAWQDIMPTVLNMADLPVPEYCDGLSFAKTIFGENDVDDAGQPKKEREYLHGECCIGKVRFGGYEKQQQSNCDIVKNWCYEQGCHYITDGQYKYIWFTQTGREQLFDLEKDYEEKYDLSKNPEYLDLLELLRKKLIQALTERPEGFTDGKQLISGKEESQLSPEMHKVAEQRILDGQPVAYYAKSMQIMMGKKQGL